MGDGGYMRYLSREDVLRYDEVGVREIIVLNRIKKYEVSREAEDRVLLGEKFMYRGVKYVRVRVDDVIAVLGESFDERGGLDFVRCERE